MIDMLLILAETFFVKDNHNHVLVLHPSVDVLVKDVTNALNGFNLDDYIIENVYMPTHNKHVVKISW